MKNTTRREALASIVATFGAATVSAMTLRGNAMAATPRCTATQPDIEGPYYLPNAPTRTSLIEPDMAGTPLDLAGTLRDLRCMPIARARIELWQCDAHGQYDTRGSRLRAQFETDTRGRFALQTIVPGRYLNGPQYRPAHLHMKIWRGGRALTTQWYFAGDPYNANDRWFRAERALTLVSQARGVRAQLDAVVR
ncbi:MAG: intradiol ring-cleavage dioxygenase [Deltaproteobacteria bacterium]|nr:intradiol ring-cleavage dioxygenase [Deltaproteobacteria bacterium]